MDTSALGTYIDEHILILQEIQVVKAVAFVWLKFLFI